MRSRSIGRLVSIVRCAVRKHRAGGPDGGDCRRHLDLGGFLVERRVGAGGAGHWWVVKGG
jgi:hypothetical protein